MPAGSQSTSDILGAPIAVDWVGWEQFGWYIDYPKVFPPKEGWPSFESAIARTQDLGNRIWLVPDTVSFSSRLPDWTQAKTAILVDANGISPFPSDYAECGGKTTFYQMCPSTAYWQGELRSLLLEMARHNPDIIQLDGFPLLSAIPCYSTTHGHQPGAPDAKAAVYRALFERIKADARVLNPKVQISAEGMAEFYLGFLDSVSDPFTTGWTPLSLAAAVTDPLKVQLIPLWQAVYHDSTLIQSGLSLIRRQTNAGDPAADEHVYFLRGLGRALVWGEVPSFAADRGLEDLNAESEVAFIEYLKRIAEARRGYRPKMRSS